MSALSAMGRLQIGGASLIYQTIDAADGGSMPFVFQHGMGGDANQPLGYVGDAPPTPVISLNACGHGASSDIDRCLEPTHGRSCSLPQGWAHRYTGLVQHIIDAGELDNTETHFSRRCRAQRTADGRDPYS